MGAMCPPGAGKASGGTEAMYEAKEKGLRSSEKHKMQQKEDSKPQDLAFKPEPLFEANSPLSAVHEPHVGQVSEPIAHVLPVENQEPVALQPPAHVDDPPMLTVTPPPATGDDTFTSAGGDPHLANHHSHLLSVPGSRSHSRQPSAGHCQDADGDFGRQASQVSHAAWSDWTGPRHHHGDFDCQASHVSHVQSDWTGPRYQHQGTIVTHSRQPSHASGLGAGQRQISRHSVRSAPHVTQLRLQVIRAHDLRNTDLGLLPGDVSDPFVVARLGSQEFKTSVISNNLNPVWNSPHFEFDIAEDDQNLRLEVFSSNQWHADDSLGFIEVLVQNLQPNKAHKIVTKLNEGKAVRMDQKQARLEVEVLRVDSTAPQHVIQTRPAVDAYAQQLALMTAARQGRPVPLPSFHDMGPEAFHRPPRQSDRRAGVPEYGSSASRLGHYDYSQDPKYHPSQAQTSKKTWIDDPFYGWRSQTEPRPSTQLVPFCGPQGRRLGGARVSEKWLQDPFSGWLQKDNNRCEVDENHPELLQAQEDRRLRSLPSFRDVDVKRFNDNREYSRLHQAERRMRWTEGHHEMQQPLENVWQQDAFYGWLPGRGPSGDHTNLPRPLDKARMNRLPSFSGDQALLGLTGHGLGILHISIKRATDLKYRQAHRHGKPSACVHFQLVYNKEESSRTEATATVPHDQNPRWTMPMVPLEVMTLHDKIQFKVLDLESPEEEILGEARVPVERLIERLKKLSPQEAALPRKFKESLGAPSQNIEFEVIFEKYQGQAPVPRMLTNGTPKGSGFTAAPKIGVLSVRIIAAFNLVNADTGLFGDVSDPFVEMWLGSQSRNECQKTATINNDLNPVWNTSAFLFPLTMEDNLLHLEVYDEDMITSHDFLGRLTIPLYNIMHGEPNEAVRIRDQLQDIKHGELEVEVEFKPE